MTILQSNTGYFISTPVNNSPNNEMVDYFYNNLSSHTTQKDLVSKTEERDVNFKLHIDNSIEYDYTIDKSNNTYEIIAKNRFIMICNIWELIKLIIESDNRFNGESLSPSIIDLDNKNNNDTFKFREINGILNNPLQEALNDTEHSFTITDDKLINVLTNYNDMTKEYDPIDDDMTIFAIKINDTYDFNQINLTSHKLFKDLERHIATYGDNKSFAISELIIQGEEESYATRRFF